MRFWISFATPTGNAGVIITDADNFADALAKTIETGINPGPHTSVKAFALEGLDTPAKFLDRLLTEKEVASMPQPVTVRSVPIR